MEAAALATHAGQSVSFTALNIHCFTLQLTLQVHMHTVVKFSEIMHHSVEAVAAVAIAQQ
jgi:hypothetical protein